eukprot:1406552-Pleurochrysis_carterae.AAC.1
MYKSEEDAARAVKITELVEDVDCTRIQCVLLGKHDEMLLPAGFLYGARPEYTAAGGWESFRSYCPPP